MEKKIMIVDDAMFMRKVIRKSLEEEGYHNIIEAGDGETAVDKFLEERPDLMILDITMPGMSGMEVLVKLREKAPWAKIIMCSAVGQEDTILRAVKLGAADFIVKPFKSEELKRIVNHNLIEV